MRLDSGNARRERVSVADLVGEAEIEAGLEAKAGGFALEVVNVAPGIDVEGDPQILAAALGNLLQNAFRYTPVDGRVDVSVAEVGDGTLETTVRDTGCGISEANLGKVFDRFFTTEPKSMPKDYGSGLGLAIARSIIENHQGTIRVASRPGEGAAFSFRLPQSA